MKLFATFTNPFKSDDKKLRERCIQYASKVCATPYDVVTFAHAYLVFIKKGVNPFRD